MKKLLLVLLCACGDNDTTPDAAVTVDASVDADPYQDARVLTPCEVRCQYSLSYEHWLWCIELCEADMDAGIGP